MLFACVQDIYIYFFRKDDKGKKFIRTFNIILNWYLILYSSGVWNVWLHFPNLKYFRLHSPLTVLCQWQIELDHATFSLPFPARQSTVIYRYRLLIYSSLWWLTTKKGCLLVMVSNFCFVISNLCFTDNIFKISTRPPLLECFGK